MVLAVNIPELVTENQEQNSVSVKFPENTFSSYKINKDFLSDHFFVDVSLAKKLGLLFDFESVELKCGNCVAYRVEPISKDIFKESCYRLNEVHTNKSISIFDRKPCNYYTLTYKYNLSDPEMYPKLEKVFDLQVAKLDLRPEAGYKNLLDILTEEKWIERIDIL